MDSYACCTCSAAEDRLFKHKSETAHYVSGKMELERMMRNFSNYDLNLFNTAPTHGRLPKRLCLKVAALPAHPGDPPYLEDKHRKHVKHPLKTCKTMKFEETSGNCISAADFRSLVVQL